MYKFLILFVMLFSFSYSQNREYEREDNDANLRFGIGVTAAYFNPVDADNGGIMGGLVARAKFLRFFGAEFSVNYRSEDYGGDFVAVTTVPILLSGMVYPVDFLYGLVGIGYYSASINYSDLNHPLLNLNSETEGEIGTHLGLGFTVPFSNHYRMFGDVRYHFLGYELKRLENLGQSVSTYEVDANFVSINLGVLLEF